MNAIAMMLGDYPFGIDTAAYDQISHKTPHRWSELPRLGTRPALQHLGIGVETVEMHGRIFPHWHGGLWQVDALRRLAGTGEPQLLIDGMFIVWGHYVIRDVEETQPLHFAGGMPRRQDFRLSLARYPDAIPSLADGSIFDAAAGLSDRARAWTTADLTPDMEVI